MADLDYKRRIGDRKEGRQLRSLPPFYKFTPYITKQKNEAGIFFKDSVEAGQAYRFIKRQRAQGYKGMAMLHLFIATYVRTVAARPGMNRFVSGQRLYSRNHIAVALTVRKSLAADGAETTMKIQFDPTDTIFDVYRRISEGIDAVRADDGVNETERVVGNLLKMPGPVLKLFVWLLGLLDYFDWLPGSLIKASPYHSSAIVTDLASLGMPPIYRHLNNFGNAPLSLSFGAGRTVMELDKNGEPAEGRYIDYTVVMDGRICDKYYSASVLKYLRYYLKNPELLAAPPENVEEDIF